jgi:hypothetical protein
MLLGRHCSYWLVLLGTTLFATIDTGLFLVVLALGLSGTALVWTVMLAGALLAEALGAEPVDDATPGACPFRAWRGGTRISSSARQTPSDPGGFS